MPFANVNTIRIYYEIHGPSNGTPLTLIAGWGNWIWVWFRQIPTLSQKYKIIIFDNRGAGRSSKPDVEYSAEMLASDVKSLLDFLRVSQTHLFGISLGGFIAQQFAFSYPQMVKGLALSSTSFGDGNPNVIQRSDEILAKMFTAPTETISLEQSMAIRRSISWSADFLTSNHALVKQMDRWITDRPTPAFALGRQAQASMNFNSESFLSSVTIPTLILHGMNDQIIPPENAKMLFRTLPNSKLIYFKNGSHRIRIENYHQFNQVLLEFYDQVDNGTFQPESNEIII